jgi:energy-converting hydrogenase Eha subunit F
MNRKQSAVALSVLVMGGVVLTTTEASATYKDPEPWSMQQTPAPEAWPDEGTGYPQSEPGSTEYNYPNYDPTYEVPPAQVASVTRVSDDNGVEVLQSGASALGGAAVAMGAMWFYRRRHVVAG